MRFSNSSRVSGVLRWMVAAVVIVIVPQVVQAQWRATIGAQTKDMGRQAFAFLPNEIWIHEGDSITWTFDTDEIHTLSFLTVGQVRQPFGAGCPGFSTSPAMFDGTKCVSTPALVKGESFTVNFPETGDFKFVCLVHANMTGVVHVLELGETLPHGPDFYEDQAEQHGHALLADADRGRDDDGEESEHRHSGENHVTAGGGEISATAGGQDTLVIMRFMEHTTVIHAGQTVEWTNPQPTGAHTITFGIEPTNLMPPSGNVTLDTDGARKATINSTSDSVHSGFIAAASQERTFLPESPRTVTRFRVTFTKAGTYPYICALHDNLGMKGKVIVLP